jgi:single-strand DNA-binding protein
MSAAASRTLVERYCATSSRLSGIHPWQSTVVGSRVLDQLLAESSQRRSLALASPAPIQQNGKWRVGETSFLKVNLWWGQAEHLADSLSKGDRVIVTGRLRQRSWETPEGDNGSVTEIEADEVGASLKWATAKVERTSQRGNGERSSGRERQAERGGDFNDAPPTY